MHGQHDETSEEGDPATAEALARPDAGSGRGLLIGRTGSPGWRG